MNNNIENEDSLNTEEEETSKNDEGGEEEKDYKTMYENQKIRAEKAEKARKETTPEVKETPKKEEGETSKQEPSLSVMDSARLQEAKIPVEDWDEVVDYARYKKVPIAEAMESGVVKATLAGRIEERKTASASNTGSGKRGTSKVSGETALANARQGKFKEDDVDAVVEARLKA